MALNLRVYQQKIVETARNYNTLVVLPTGLGKTHIAMELARLRIAQYPDHKVLILAPTKPLVEQHHTTFKNHLEGVQSSSVLLTGKVAPDKRADYFKANTYVFSTPQTIENDLLSRRISLENVCLLVIDEAHRATGDYSYVYIVDQYRKQASRERILALTASPGSKQEVIMEVINNCGVEKIEVRSISDPDVADYVQETTIKYDEVCLPEDLSSLRAVFERLIRVRTDKIKELTSSNKDVLLSKKSLLSLQKELQSTLKEGSPDPSVWSALSLLAEVMKLHHAQELLETQSLEAFLKYILQLKKQASQGKSKAVKNILSDPEFKSCVIKARDLFRRGVEHPKFIRLISLVKLELAKHPDSQIIIFSQYRDVAIKLVDTLGDISRLFVGQQKKRGVGLSQKQQKQVLDEFRDGKFPVLVATQVGEEGLDIPTVDLVIFYEPVASSIRTIQRRGRTGRHNTGRVIVLVCKDTRDVVYRWSAHHKENQMYRNLKKISHTPQPKKQPSLSSFDDTEVTIHADSREKSSGVLKQLRDLGVDVILQNLEVGDYLLSQRVCVEFKMVDDFVNSLLDGRLFEQLSKLTAYQRPLLIIQGSNWYEQRNVHPNAIRGALSAIGVSYGVPILVTQNDADTASLLYTIALREKQGGVSGAKLVNSKNLKSDLLSVVASMPGVGPVLANNLLNHFGSIRKIVSASKEELAGVTGFGKKKASKLYDFFDETL